jgi:hypothetical protein
MHIAAGGDGTSSPSGRLIKNFVLVAGFQFLK